MANPRQRRKSRSSSHRPVSHSRHAKRNLKKTPPIRGPKILQDAWNDRKTVRQNYAALGLVHTLNPSASGGVEPLEGQSLHYNHDMTTELSQPITESSLIPKGFGRIIRDETGNVLGIDLADGDKEELQDVKEKDMEELASDMDGNIISRWVTDLGGGGRVQPDGTEGSVANALERMSTVKFGSTTLSVAISGAGPRHSSTGEIAYLGRLVSKHGADLDRMAKDRKLNPDQRTAAELGRALRRAGLNSVER